VLRALVDPNTALLRAEPRDGRDLIIAATNGWLVGLDNLSHLSPWLSDALCRLATGGGFATRELYTDSDETLFDAQRPVILNGIEELATRGDLLDRSIILYLPSIPEAQRRPEVALWHDFETARPRILGALLDAVSTALARVATVKLNRLPRMADFAVWITAAEAALGWEPGTFMVAYTGNREAANELTLEASLIAPAIRKVADAGFTGTATELLRRLYDQAEETLRRQKGWPANPRALSGSLRRIAPNLRAVGINVEFLGNTGSNRHRLIVIGRRVQPSEEGEFFRSARSWVRLAMQDIVFSESFWCVRVNATYRRANATRTPAYETQMLEFPINARCEPRERKNAALFL
jgi:hypothetical protein